MVEYLGGQRGLEEKNIFVFNIWFSSLTSKLPKSIGHVVVAPVATIVVAILENNLAHTVSQAALPPALKKDFLVKSWISMKICNLVYVAVCISHHTLPFHNPLNPVTLVGISCNVFRYSTKLDLMASCGPYDSCTIFEE